MRDASGKTNITRNKNIIKNCKNDDQKKDFRTTPLRGSGNPVASNRRQAGAERCQRAVHGVKNHRNKRVCHRGTGEKTQGQSLFEKMYMHITFDDFVYSQIQVPLMSMSEIIECCKITLSSK